jgi:phosphate transport system protein
MAKHLERDLDHLKHEILAVGTLVEEAIDKSLRLLRERDGSLIDEIVAGDEVIDHREVEVEEECLKVMALHQPMAADLRFVISVLKVNNDLERMGDLACNIARRTRHTLMRPQNTEPLVRFEELGQKVLTMVHESLEALVHQDAAMARKVCRMDEEVDQIHRATYELLKHAMRESPDAVEEAVSALTVSRSLERIADLATNIAEDIVFMVDGEVIRHQADGH